MPEPTSGMVAAAARAAMSVTRFRPWATARRHDRLVRNEYEDLNTWAADDLQREAQDLDGLRAQLAARGRCRAAISVAASCGSATSTLAAGEIGRAPPTADSTNGVKRKA